MIILIADDDIEDQELLRDAIMGINPDIRVDTVFNGRESITYLENCKLAGLPGAVVLDYNMPIMGGSEVLDVICNDQRFDEISKFIWSTSNTKTHINECLERGANEYFVKPDNSQKLFYIASVLVKAVLERP